MDAFSLSLSYGIMNVGIKKVITTALAVGIFHFFMPILGNYVGVSIFNNIIIKPKYILFIIFFAISLDMFLNYFKGKQKLIKLSLLGILFFAFSVSLDSFSVGIGINYLYDNILKVVIIFCITSFLFTLSGFLFGKKLSFKAGKHSFLIGSLTLFLYSIWVLTK